MLGFSRLVCSLEMMSQTALAFVVTHTIARNRASVVNFVLRFIRFVSLPLVQMELRDGGRCMARLAWLVVPTSSAARFRQRRMKKAGEACAFPGLGIDSFYFVVWFAAQAPRRSSTSCDDGERTTRPRCRDQPGRTSTALVQDQGSPTDCSRMPVDHQR